ncbi:armadillo-type protein [Gongronella butleri]|nr:armadillo-type protein [Gongronella butleri]
MHPPTRRRADTLGPTTSHRPLPLPLPSSAGGFLPHAPAPYHQYQHPQMHPHRHPSLAILGGGGGGHRPRASSFQTPFVSAGLFDDTSNPASSSHAMIHTNVPTTASWHQPTSPTSELLLRGDANDTITSTLASLGLDDLDKHHFRGKNANNNPSVTAAAATLTPATMLMMDYPSYAFAIDESEIVTRPSRVVWIGHLVEVNLDQLVALLGPYGAVESIRRVPEHEGVLVQFYRVEDAMRAMQAMLDGALAGVPTSQLAYVDPATASSLTLPTTTTTAPATPMPPPQTATSNATSVSSYMMDFVQEPTRALWIGNLPAIMTPTSLYSVFSFFGSIESVRILSHKSCGFVNYYLQDDAIRARKSLHGKEVLPGSGPIRIGYAKVPASNIKTSNASSSPSSASASAFIPGVVAASNASSGTHLHTSGRSSSSGGATDDRAAPASADHAAYSGSSNLLWHHPSLYHLPSIYTERQQIMTELGEEPTDGPIFDVMQPAGLLYASAIVPAPELGSHRALDTTRLREIKKRLENDQHLPLQEVERMAHECMPDLVELCSDFIGNTVVQRLFERCSDTTKDMMLDRVAPHLASIGVHKNGTWAAQRIVDTAKTSMQINMVCESLKPFVPALLLDQFGNYVVQCCLALGPRVNQFVFDAIVSHCWEIAQGRFGARAVRATLESPYVTKRQQKYVAATLIQHALLLATNANGALLLIWLLDTSALAGRYSVLATRLLPHLAKLCTHKLASLTVLKLINQRQEPQARLLILNALFFATPAPPVSSTTTTNTSTTTGNTTSASPSQQHHHHGDQHQHSGHRHHNSHHQSILYEVINDQVHGVNLIQKILSSNYVDLSERQRMAEKVKQLLAKHKLLHVQGYKRLLEEINMVLVDSNPGPSLAASLPSLMLPPSSSSLTASSPSLCTASAASTSPAAAAMMHHTSSGSSNACRASGMATVAASMAMPPSSSLPSSLATATSSTAMPWHGPDWATIQAHYLSAAQAVFQQQFAQPVASTHQSVPETKENSSFPSSSSINNSNLDSSSQCRSSTSSSPSLS